jgi:hypothetical protein
MPTGLYREAEQVFGRQGLFDIAALIGSYQVECIGSGQQVVLIVGEVLQFLVLKVKLVVDGVQFLIVGLQLLLRGLQLLVCRL